MAQRHEKHGGSLNAYMPPQLGNYSDELDATTVDETQIYRQSL
jgi:hypothetical protein